MGWFRKSTPIKVPTRWTPELWRAASGSGSRFDATVVIRAVKESGEWIYASRRMSHDIEYRGTLDRLPGDPLNEVPVDLRIETGLHPNGLQYGDTQTLGLAYTGAYGDERTGIPLLSFRIWGDEAGAAAFDAAFMRALAARQDGLRVWFSADLKAPSTASVTGFDVIQPVSRIKFEQSFRVGAYR